MKETCPTCLGHGFVFSLAPVSAPPKPIETDEKPKRPIKGVNGNLSHLRRL
jgi:hypothetical protein